MKDEFLFLSKLSESLNVNVLLSPGLTDENCLKIADCVRKKLNDLRAEVEQLVLRAPRKTAMGYLQAYQYYLQKLMDVLEHELIRQKCMSILSGDETWYFFTPQYTLLKVINRELEYLLESHRAVMDLSLKMPAVSRIGFYNGFVPEATVFLEKVGDDLDDKVLADIICDFVRSFRAVQSPYRYTFSDRDCVLNLFSMLIPVLNSGDGVDKSTAVRDILMAMWRWWQSRRRRTYLSRRHTRYRRLRGRYQIRLRCRIKYRFNKRSVGLHRKRSVKALD